ncbi:NDJ1 (YOL104C) [Zygosaccharomyces parabailii]|nr:NDJ1 (YOL104C) [Zygosaccharomyces parabailii]CDH12925.1 uncharacterized protein ZBAI_04711 [Zygosaccharomyces bailii ISA1307]
MSDVEVKSEFSNIPVVSSAHSSTYRAKTPLPFPPDQFINTIQDRKLVSCPNSCFVLYTLNCAQLKFETSKSHEFPFELFRDCYDRSKARFDLSKYFEVGRLDAPLDQDITWEGTTVSETAREEVSMLPYILCFHKTTVNLNTERHLQSHVNKFEELLERFNSRKLPHLYINWFKLIESYAELVFRDLLVKWCQWLHSVKAMGHRRTVQTVLRTWLNRLNKQFWSRYFIFEHSVRSSVDDMGRNLKNLAEANELDLDGTSSSYGVWLDSKNGILLFGSGLPLREVQVSPICGVCLDQLPAAVTTRKLLFFVNIAILECFVKEIS